jgi:hypothetical protein
MNDESNLKPTSAEASDPSTDGATRLVDVTVPVPAGHLGSFFRAVAVWYEDEHDDEGWRGGRMTMG